MKPWYEELFENYARSYDQESYTQGTPAEVDFIEQEIAFNKNTAILDIGCGTGRHAVELARHGYRVTGIDLSENQLARARQKAKEHNLKIQFLRADARTLDFVNEFNLVIMICEGAFPLMETDEMNFKILKNAANALKAKGKLIFTTLNALFPLHHDLKEFYNGESQQCSFKEAHFDLATFRFFNVFSFTDDAGNKKTLQANERFYAPSEINWYLTCLGFSKIDIYGCDAGKFNRQKKISADDHEMLVIAQK